jgi:enediyne biosynthesis protein E4
MSTHVLVSPFRLAYLVGLLVAILSICSEPLAAAEPLAFRNAGDESGLFPHVEGIAGHGVIWGDVDGNGYPDLYVGTFGGAPYGSKANQFFRNTEGKFTLDDQTNLHVLGRANGGVMADFDNDGDLDLYITNHAIDGGTTDPHYAEPNHLFRNDGAGKFVDISEESATCPKGIAARSATVLDFDGDGLLDLLVGECIFQGGMSRTRLYRNLGGLKFQNVSQEVGLPVELTGLGVAAGDVNGDTWPDLFAAGRLHGNQLFLNDGKGHFTVLPATQGNFQWDYGQRILDDTACGAMIGDANRDGRPDILVGSHYSHPWMEASGGIAMRLYLQQPTASSSPTFVDVTEQVGLTPLAMKTPHVEIQDFDNDGWPDLYTSILKRANGKLYPIIHRGQGIQNGLPKFQIEGWDVNDFPTAEDRLLPGSGPFYDKMKAENKIIYTAPGPTADYDRDGRLDMFLANWWVDDKSFLMHNETKSGNWLDVSVVGGEGVNKQGIGSAIRIYRAGMLGDPAGLIGMKEIAVGYGYASGQEASAHFGLGELEKCDVEVILPHGKGKLEQKDVKANQRLTLGK